MSETNEISHPSLKQFKAALDSRKVGRALVDTFDRWRNNGEKCAPESDLKAAADALWGRFQTEMGGQPSAPSATPQNPNPKPAFDPKKRGRSEERGSGGRGSSR